MLLKNEGFDIVLVPAHKYRGIIFKN